MEVKFENLKPSDYEGKSPVDWGYNCISWAMGRNDKPFWPSKQLTFYSWPIKLPRQDVGQETLANFVKAFRRLRYKPLIGKNYSLEKGFEKVAIYVNNQGTPTHAARQLPSGVWTSKMGDEQDVEHINPSVLEGNGYGTVAIVMKRKSNKF